MTTAAPTSRCPTWPRCRPSTTGAGSSRAGRRSTARRRRRRPARHQARAHPLPDRVHRLGRPCCSCSRAGVLFVTDGRYDGSPASSWRRRARRRPPGRHRRRDRGDGRAARGGGGRRVERAAGSGSRRRAVTWAAQRALRRRLVPRRRAGADREPARGAARAQGAGRDRPGRSGRRHRRRRPRPLPSAAAAPGRPRPSSPCELDTAMRRLGASGPAFDTIIAAGAELGQAPPPPLRPRRIAEGDLVVVDFGATVDGYRSDMTRTLCVGEPSADQRRLHAAGGPCAGGRAGRGPGRRVSQGRRRCRPRRRRGGRPGRPVPPRHRARRRPRDPRGPVRGPDVDCYALRVQRGHRGTGCLPRRASVASAPRTPCWSRWTVAGS